MQNVSKLALLLTTPSWIALVNYSKPSAKWSGRFHQTGFRFDKSIALNRKILNRFGFGLANRLRPKTILLCYDVIIGDGCAVPTRQEPTSPTMDVNMATCS